jgi:hypothetical protein
LIQHDLFILNFCTPLVFRRIGMPAQNQNNSRKAKEFDFNEERRPYGLTSDEGLQFYLKAYTRRWQHAKEKGHKMTMKWHMRAIVTEIKLRGGNIDTA